MQIFQVLTPISVKLQYKAKARSRLTLSPHNNENHNPPTTLTSKTTRKVIYIKGGVFIKIENPNSTQSNKSN